MKSRVQQIQESLGFDVKKAVIYYQLITGGEQTASEIAKAAKIKRTTVYNIIPELLDGGYIIKTKSGKKTLFYVDNVSDILSSQLDAQKAKTLRLASELQTELRQIKFRPKVLYFEGGQGFKDFYKFVFQNTISDDRIYTYIGDKDFQKLFTDELEEELISIRKKRKIYNQVITFESQVSKEWVVKQKDDFRSIRFISNVIDKELSADIKIFSGHVGMMSYKEDFTGIIIKSDELYSMQKNWFLNLWDIL
jgi:sugar-specific transcriptional regulator TrmB